MSLARAERIKLMAAALNNLAVAVMVSSVVVPAIGSIGGVAGAHLLRFTPLWFLAAMVLHLAGQSVLGALDR